MEYGMTITKKAKKGYSTEEISEITGLTEPRIHQMRNGQRVKIKSNNKVYEFKPLLEKGKHWDWNETDVIIFPEGLKAIQARRTKLMSKKSK